MFDDPNKNPHLCTLFPTTLAITVTPKLQVMESSSGLDDEFQNEQAAKETDNGEDEIEESEATADCRMKWK